MDDQWYYVQDGGRVGPIDKSQLLDLISGGTLKGSDFVWRNGFENWTPIAQVTELSSAQNNENLEPPVMTDEARLLDIGENEKIIFLKIGKDRGGREVEYGPYNLQTLKKLYMENRINGKTFIYTKYIKSWKLLADFVDFENVFQDMPPAITEEDKRAFRRKPFIARMFFANHEELFEGICRDISIGGMQVLVDHFPGKVGERISINVHPENSDHHFVASGEIVRKLEGDHGFSFRFIDLSSEAVEAIQSYIAQDD